MAYECRTLQTKETCRCHVSVIFFTTVNNARVIFRGDTGKKYLFFVLYTQRQNLFLLVMNVVIKGNGECVVNNMWLHILSARKKYFTLNYNFFIIHSED